MGGFKGPLNLGLAASNTTFSTGTVVLSGQGAVVVGTGAGSILISAPTAIAGLVASNTTFTGGSVVISGSGDVTVNSGAGSIIIDGGNDIKAVGVAGVTTYSTGTVVLSAGANISLSTNAQTISIIGPNPGAGAGITASFWPEWLQSSVLSATLYSGSVGAGGNSTNTTMSAYVWPVAIDDPVAFNRLRIPALLTASTSMTTAHWTATLGFYLDIMTLNGANLSKLSAFSNEQRITYSSAAVSTNASASWQLSNGGGAGGSSSTSISTNNAGSTLFWTSVTNTKMVNLNWSTVAQTIPAGQYWFVLGMSYATAGSNVFAISQVAHEAIATAVPFITPDQFWDNPASSHAPFPLQGIVSYVKDTNNSIPLSIATTNITTNTNAASAVYRRPIIIFASHP